jgi:hypothetical protein
VRKELFVRAIHLGKVVHAVQEHVDLDHLGDVRPGLGQNGLDVLGARRRLHRDAAVHQLAVRVGRDLARDEDEAVGYDGLGLWTG